VVSAPAAKSPGYQPKVALSYRKVRSANSSAVTNGSVILAGCDHRSARMRRLKDLIGGHVADLGGRDMISEAEFCLVRRCALLTLELELLEARFEAHDGASATDLQLYQQVASSLRRLHESLGLKRRSRDVTAPDLQTYIRDNYGRDAEEEAA
jgi:hypothetical protein